jgi:alkanesulfonate monooxygenase SsuD/methylene tetrahydromethanopterin reductase-like flavin-dependent oxidoreductase (luciferase family)
MTRAAQPEPFGPGSFSFGLHAVDGAGGPAQAAALVEQARAAEAAGFDGVTMSEHHGGFPGYLPQPLMVASWVLAATDRLWSGPAPYLLNLRNPVLVAEELAWLAARHPGRVGAVFAPGYAKSDFDLLGVDFADRPRRFAAALDVLLATLRGETAAAADPAIAAWAAAPGPVLSAANSTAAVRRAAARGTGVFFPGGETRERMRTLIDRYRDAGGPGPVVKIRTLWMGEPPPGALEERDRLYREAAAASGMRQATGFAEPFAYGEDARILEEVATDMTTLGIDGMNIRLYLAGVGHAALLEQIARFGETVLPHVPVPTVGQGAVR